MIEQWLPTMVAAGALGLVWFGIRAQKKEVKDDVDNIKEVYLKKNDHGLLCENAALKVNQHLTEELTNLKDAIFGELRSIKTTIKNNNKG